MVRNNIGVDVFKLANRLTDVGQGNHSNDPVRAAATALKVRVGTEVFNLTPEQVLDIKNGRR